jgi:DNA (cytosine-5)-methyltransferase 1
VTVWHSDLEDAPSRILEHHWPGVPNLGDVTTIDWATVPPVDVICGGFPCQDVSLAGLRRGLRPDTRSGLWSHFAAAIDTLRPRLVVVENVRGLLSAEAHSDLEPDPWDLGGPARADRPALRALGAVLGDLADLGYDAEWLGVRAADAGAPHGRFRVFVLARPADPDDERFDGTAPARDARGQRLEDRDSATQDADVAARGELGLAAPGQSEGRGARADARGRGRTATPDPRDDRRGAVEAAHDEDGPLTHWDEPDGRAPADPGGVDGERRGAAGDVARPSGPTQGAGDQRERDGDAAHDRGAAPAWVTYEPTIRRWESTVGRVAPAPTERSAAGGQRLSPAFVEWMMGLPAGHVTAPEIGLTRAQQLKALGNGVVPQQAALALRTLLGGVS